MNQQTMYIPVLLGTSRQGRQSEHVAHFVLAQIQSRAGIESELIDVRELPLSLKDAGEQIKIPEFSQKMTRCDGLVIITPEYNHGYPGLLKHALDTNLEEYNHKAAGICGVSAGSFGGARVIENLLPVLRELGLVATAIDLNFGNVSNVFAPDGTLQDQSFVRRTTRFLDELIWMARVLKHGRENIAPV